MKRNVFAMLAVILVLAVGCLTGCGASSGSASGTSGAASDPALDGEREVTQADYMDVLNSCVDQIRGKTEFKPDIAVVLGSGLGDFVEEIDVVSEIPFNEIQGFPGATAPDHAGKLIFGTLKDKNVVVMQGRIHYYEGYSMQEVVLPIRVLRLLGADTVILTNSAGAINRDYAPGDFMAISDHISSFVPSPLIGENLEELGDRFVDMTQVYDKDLLDLIQTVAKENDITVHQGVYIQLTGPQFETPTEIKMYRNMGADAVGMSTAVEAIAARHMGMRVCGISCITNMAAGMQAEVNDEEVKENAGKAMGRFVTLLDELVERMPE